MSDLSFQTLFQLFLFLLFPFLTGVLAVKLKISALIGYIVGGVILNLIFGAMIPRNFINQFSMLGLILLVFTIGLETNFATIKRFGKFVFLGGLLQIGFSFVLILLLSLLFHFSFVESLFFGFAFALSSTAVVSKIIQERGEENSLLGGLAIGVLIFQDLAFIPILIILSSFGEKTISVNLVKNIGLNSIKAVLVLSLVYYLGVRVVPWLFNKIARISREVLNLFVIAFIIASLTLFSFFGLSSLLAGFIAGILLGQTLEHFHIFSQIRPIRDLLVVVFFVFLGLTIQPGFVIANIVPILGYTFILIVIKFVVVLVIYLVFQFHSRTAFSLAVYLFQIGEDAFILIYQGLVLGAIGENSYHFAVTVVLFTLVFTPLFISNRDRAYLWVRKFIKTYLPFLEKFIKYRLDRDIPNIDVLKLKKHIIICGYGRVGRYIGRALMMSNIPFIAIDYNFHIVERAKKDGVSIIYGDPTEIDVLDYAECEHASILISAVPERFSQEMIVFNAKKLNPEIVIFTRVHTDGDHIRMRDLGVTVVVQPEFEASLSIIRRILRWRGLTGDEISGNIKRLKMEHGMV